MHSKKRFFPVRQTVILLILLLSMLSCGKSSDSAYSVLKGEFIQSVTESGELQASNASAIIMPKISYRYGYNFKIIGIVEHGSMVEKGDSVVAFDNSSVIKYIINQEEALENAIAKTQKQEVQSNIQRRDLEVQLKNQEAAYDLKKLELEKMQFESDKKRKVTELEFKKASLQLKKVKRKLALYPLLEKYNQQINELVVMQRRADIQNATDVLKRLVIFSPGDGYFISSYNRRGGHNYALGDDVYMGTLIASIPDVSRMKAKSSINETDISKVETGMKVIVRLDALPDINFKATVKEISKICTKKGKQKIFTTTIDILEKDLRLKPGMSVSCEYICFESDNELFVPNECLLTEGEKVYVFAKKGKKYHKTQVETGISNANHTIIYTKLRPGRELLPVEEESDI